MEITVGSDRSKIFQVMLIRFYVTEEVLGVFLRGHIIIKIGPQM